MKWGNVSVCGENEERGTGAGVVLVDGGGSGGGHIVTQRPRCVFNPALVIDSVPPPKAPRAVL